MKRGHSTFKLALNIFKIQSWTLQWARNSKRIERPDRSNLTIVSNIRQLFSARWVQLFKFYFSSNSSQDCNSAAPISSTALGSICEPFIAEFLVYTDGKTVFSFRLNRSWIWGCKSGKILTAHNYEKFVKNKKKMFFKVHLTWVFRTQCSTKIRKP